MKFYLVDDMHLEFSGYTMPGDPDGILLLAGDITTPCVYREGRTDQTMQKLKPRFNKFFEETSLSYKKVFYIPGNHEYYHGTWEDTIPFMRKAVEPYPNITVLDKEWVDLGDDIHLFGATFWTDFRQYSDEVMNTAKYSMNDYRLISQIDRSVTHGVVKVILRPQTVYDDHCLAKQALIDGLQTRTDKKVVVMTHHAPSLKSSHPRWGGTTNPLNWAYCSELDQFVIDNPQITNWVHGHTHESHDYYLNKTRVLCNPRGYSYKENQGDENPKFNDKLCFEVV